MTERSNIEWTDATFNPWEGCQKMGLGCDHCYAETRNARFGGGVAPNWGPGAPRRRTSAENWRQPIKWNAEHDAFVAEHGRRRRVFCASLADVFDNAVDPQWRIDLLQLIADTPNLDWLLLTKRIGNAHQMLDAALDVMSHGLTRWADYPWPNVWIGATIANQIEADRDIPKLMAVPARVRFLSMEPLLGPVDLTRIDINGWAEIYPLTGTTECTDDDGNPMPDIPALDWIIVGGESGPGARPMHPAWARSLRDQCAAAGVPFLFKQWGEWTPGVNVERHAGIVKTAMWLNSEWSVGMESLAADDGHIDDEPDLYRVGKKAAGRRLDGCTHNEFPRSPKEGHDHVNREH